MPGTNDPNGVRGSNVQTTQSTDWDRVTRRYRRGPGGWWWLALLAVPAILAAIGLGMGGSSTASDSAASGAGATASATDGSGASDTATDSASDTASASATDTGAAGAVPAAYSVKRAGNDVTVTATVPDEAAKTALLDAAKASAAGANVIDKVTVTAGSTGPAAAALAPVLTAAAKTGDFGVDWDGASALVLTGVAPTDADKAAVETAAKAAAPTATIDNQITVGTGSAGNSGAGCDTLQADIKAITDKTKVTFVTGGFTLTAASKTAIAGIADKVKACPTAKLAVAGHTDNDGNAAANLTLSTQRANSVKAELVKDGVAAANVTATGFGQTKPIASNSTAAGMAANRRVDITVS